MKLLTGIVLAGLLSACTAGAATPSENPLPTTMSSTAPSQTASTAESQTAMACSDAFANIDVQSVVAMGRLSAVADQLDSTILACSTADEWESAAQSALPGLDISDPQAFLAARCAEASTLVGASICNEVGS